MNFLLKVKFNSFLMHVLHLKAEYMHEKNMCEYIKLGFVCILLDSIFLKVRFGYENLKFCSIFLAEP